MLAKGEERGGAPPLIVAAIEAEVGLFLPGRLSSKEEEEEEECGSSEEMLEEPLEEFNVHVRVLGLVFVVVFTVRAATAVVDPAASAPPAVVAAAEASNFPRLFLMPLS
jgi:hypothetical protein